MLANSPILSTNQAAIPATVLAAPFGSAPNAKPTVLVVEDNNYVSAAIWTILNDFNFDVAVTASGAQGLKLAQMLSPDIVVLDVNLPEMNGLEICRHLKADRGTSNLPVVFFSAESHHAKKAMNLGAEAFLVKPYDICQLPNCLSQILAARASAQTLQNLRQTVVQ